MTTLIIIFLVLVWYLNKTSKSDYFYKKLNEIESDFELIKKVWQNLGHTKESIEKLNNAFTYFIKNPSEYNGTSVIADSWLIRKLEPESVKHDHAWIIAKSLKELHKSNIEYCEDLRKRNHQWLKVWVFIFLGLSIVSILKSIKYIKLTLKF